LKENSEEKKDFERLAEPIIEELSSKEESCTWNLTWQQ